MRQFRQLGCSLDYSRERFTMDDGYVEAVMTYFVSLWERADLPRAAHRQLVPLPPDRDLRPRGRARRADDTLVYARYPFADGRGAITIATVRPATILADVAVAVHPDDPRYTDAIGKRSSCRSSAGACR